MHHSSRLTSAARWRSHMLFKGIQWLALVCHKPSNAIGTLKAIPFVKPIPTVAGPLKIARQRCRHGSTPRTRAVVDSEQRWAVRGPPASAAIPVSNFNGIMLRDYGVYFASMQRCTKQRSVRLCARIVFANEPREVGLKHCRNQTAPQCFPDDIQLTVRICRGAKGLSLFVAISCPPR